MNDQAMLAAAAAVVALGHLLPCVGLLACGMLGRRPYLPGRRSHPVGSPTLAQSGDERSG